MIAKVLVANRGEIARRVIRACHELGLEAVAVYSEADREALHVREADEAYPLGRSRPLDSYLNIPKIVEVLKASGADAVHPGYGFLAENARFARAVEEAGAVWIGPPADVMEVLESKCRSRQLAREAGVPVVPGSLESLHDLREVEEWFERLGPPVALKIDRGGGGKGIYRVDDRSQLEAVFEAACRESEAYFGGSGVYIEKLLENPRHIEVQILAAPGRKVVHLWERECSVQRRFQKLVEESPAPDLPEEDRRRVTAMAVRLAAHLGYVNAGTVEFLRDAQGQFYFLEVNKRIQVEHPVTEMVTGRDLVQAQLLVAGTGSLPFAQEEVPQKGHAVEARIYAEDPNTFMPSPGTVSRLRLPAGEGIRVDHALEEGVKVPPYYDPLIAKLIAWGRDRTEALERLEQALAETVIDGIATSLEFHRRLLKQPEFRHGRYHTGLVAQM
ncbi:MAG: acetyl-CoA carboxylase biotin carboxylase subunit [Moorellales bacterium]